jgi:outer membrane receptor protein involved in Fe transport
MPDFLAVDTPINNLLRLAVDDMGYVNGRNKNDYKTYGYAAFGQGTYVFHPQWGMTSGLRLNYERKTRAGTQVSDGSAGSRTATKRSRTVSFKVSTVRLAKLE